MRAVVLSLTMYRAYDPNLGRWLSRDPLGEVAGTNLYAYILNNPLRFIDILGLDNASPDASLTQVGTPFENTYLGHYSLLNLGNGNLSDFLTTMLEEEGGERSVLRQQERFVLRSRPSSKKWIARLLFSFPSFPPLWTCRVISFRRRLKIFRRISLKVTPTPASIWVVEYLGRRNTLPKLHERLGELKVFAQTYDQRARRQGRRSKRKTRRCLTKLNHAVI
jgi:hypothetical protein